jgi:hypothetical protein
MAPGCRNQTCPSKLSEVRSRRKATSRSLSPARRRSPAAASLRHDDDDGGRRGDRGRRLRQEVPHEANQLLCDRRQRQDHEYDLGSAQPAPLPSGTPLVGSVGIVGLAGQNTPFPGAPRMTPKRPAVVFLSLACVARNPQSWVPARFHSCFNGAGLVTRMTAALSRCNPLLSPLRRYAGWRRRGPRRKLLDAHQLPTAAVMS